VDRPLQRYKLTIAYRGTHYHGWQVQKHSSTWKGVLPADGSGLPTIQAVCSKAIRSVVDHEVLLSGSSRTDSGVHAKGQVAHFDTPMKQIPLDGMRRACNSRMPDDIVIKSIEPVPPEFDAIVNTDRKRYQYVIWNASDRDPLRDDLMFHRWQKLDFDAMRAAAAHFQGEHDFNAFAKPGHGRATTVRMLHECSLQVRGPMVVLGVTGSGFLWNMVRIIAGTLVDIGIGHINADDIPKILASRDRRNAGNTAPAHGLYLHWIRFHPLPTSAPEGDE